MCRCRCISCCWAAFCRVRSTVDELKLTVYRSADGALSLDLGNFGDTGGGDQPSGQADAARRCAGQSGATRGQRPRSARTRRSHSSAPCTCGTRMSRWWIGSLVSTWQAPQRGYRSDASGETAVWTAPQSWSCCSANSTRIWRCPRSCPPMRAKPMCGRGSHRSCQACWRVRHRRWHSCRCWMRRWMPMPPSRSMLVLACVEARFSVHVGAGTAHIGPSEVPFVDAALVASTNSDTLDGAGVARQPARTPGQCPDAHRSATVPRNAILII